MWAGVVALGLGGMLLVPVFAADKGVEIGQTAPAFSLPDCYGNDISLESQRGKVVVLEWINQKCPVSEGHHKKHTMQDLIKKYAGKGVVWLAIDSSSFCDAEANRVYAAEMGLAYPILQDPDGKVGKAYGAQTTPHMFVIDKEGKLAYNGAIDDQKSTNYVDAALQAVLAGKTVEKSKTKPYGCGVKYK
jgi:peroxiredoxin